MSYGGGSVAGSLAIVGFSNPMINAPYFGILTTRVPAPLFGKVLQVIITSNQVAGPLGYVIAGILFSSLGLHTALAIAAAVGTIASFNFILAVLAEPPAVAQEAT